MARRVPLTKKPFSLGMEPPAGLITPEMIFLRRRKLAADAGVPMNNRPTLRKIIERRAKKVEEKFD